MQLVGGVSLIVHAASKLSKNRAHVAPLLFILYIVSVFSCHSQHGTNDQFILSSNARSASFSRDPVNNR